MTKHVTLRKTGKIGTFAVLCLAILVSGSCKSPSEPEIFANIVAQNLCGAAVDIFMDGVYQFTVEFAADETIYDVPVGTYSLQAKKQGEEVLVYSDTIEITQSLNYIVVIEGPSHIIVKNDYGQAVNVYMNGVLVGGIQSNQGVVIPNVAFGTHELAASRTSDNLLVDSISLEVEDVAEYVWIIAPPAASEIPLP